MNDMLDRYRGCLIGLACGDALGTTVEFMPRGTFPPLTTITGGGPFHLQAGEWTDDTSMALCLGASLLHHKGFNPGDQMNRYCNWRSVGYMSSTGECFDIGLTIAGALDRYLRTGEPYAGDTDPRTAGNGALMRLAPIPMFYAPDAEQVQRYALESTRTTHAAPQALDASRLFALQLRAALLGLPKDDILSQAPAAALDPAIARIAAGAWRHKDRRDIRGTGYCVDALEAALWCFWSTDTYESAVLAAANLGDDADTTAAIAGQLAGAHYGHGAIPKDWLQTLAMRDVIDDMAQQLHSAAHGSASS